jgi:hypothetical protein
VEIILTHYLAAPARVDYGRACRGKAAARRGERQPMLNRGKATLVESAVVLVLMGILAGAIGGLAIGVVTSPKSAATSGAR